ncbi:MAG: GNAT family N-acetyltransferase [Acetobacteraceae bacterium]|nr:GNAT family N-acetyltransferase [Acetobacteraceae bacterium]
MIPELRSDRLLLRAFDAAEIGTYAAFWESEASRFVGGPCSRNDAWRRMAMYAGHWLLRGYGIWAVEEAASGAFIGQAGLWFPEGWPEPEVHWTVFPAFQGRGFATEAARRVRDHARDDLGWTRLVSCIEPGNAASVAVALRLGAVRDGVAEVPPRIFDVYRHDMGK